MFQATRRRRPSSAASRPTRSRLRSAHRPEARSSRRLRTARCSACGPTLRPHRYRAAHVFVQVRLGPAPVGLEEAVSAVPRDEHRLRPGPDRAGQLGQRGPAGEKAGELGQVVAGEPEPVTPAGVAGVVREHHHAAGHAPHLAQPGDRVLPVMNGGDGHRGVEGPVRERQALRGGGHARRRARRALRPHDRRRFHRGDVAVGRLVGAGAGPDVQHRPRVAERVPDPARRSAARYAASRGKRPRSRRTTARQHLLAAPLASLSFPSPVPRVPCRWPPPWHQRGRAVPAAGRAAGAGARPRRRTDRQPGPRPPAARSPAAGRPAPPAAAPRRPPSRPGTRPRCPMTGISARYDASDLGGPS